MRGQLGVAILDCLWMVPWRQLEPPSTAAACGGFIPLRCNGTPLPALLKQHSCGFSHGAAFLPYLQSEMVAVNDSSLQQEVDLLNTLVAV